MSTPAIPKKSNSIVKQGQTASAYGSNPDIMAKGTAGEPPRDLNP